MARKKRKYLKHRERQPFHRNRWLQLFAIFVLVFAVYGNSIQNDYNIDDGYIVPLDKSNPLPAEGVSAIPRILATPYNDVEGLSYGYRPLGKVSMAIEYELWGNNPHNSHVVNLILYVLNIFILLLFVERVAMLCGFKNIHVLYIGMLIFLVHPIHTEVVCSIKNREEIMSFLFMTLGLLTFLRFSRDRKWWLVPSFILLCLLALWSKETAFNVIGVMLMLIIYQALERSGKLFSSDFFKAVFTRSRLLVLGIAIGTFIIAVLIVPSSVVEMEGGAKVNLFENNPYRFTENLQVFPIAAQTIGFYLKKLVYPVPLLYYYGYDMLPVITWGHPIAIVGLAAMLLVFGFVAYSLFKNRWRFTAFWILFFIVAIFPFSNFGFRYVTGIVGERLAYQASLGFAMLLALGLFYSGTVLEKYFTFRKWSDVRWAYTMTAIVVILFSIKTIDRSTVWKDKLTLYQNDIVHLSKSARANFMMASTYMIRVDALKKGPASRSARNQVNKYLDQSRAHLYQAVDVYPEYSDAWFSLGRIYLGYTSKIDSAIYCMERVDEADARNYVLSREMLGDIYKSSRKDDRRAYPYYLAGYRKQPENLRLYNKVMDGAFALGKLDEIIQMADRAIGIGIKEGYTDKADALIMQGDTVSAFENYEAAWNAGIRNEEIYNKLGAYYQSRGMFDELNRLGQ